MAEGGTLVRLVHDGLPEGEGEGYLEGWNHFFERLKRAAVAGDAGPDEWCAAPAELNPLTSANATLDVLQAHQIVKPGLRASAGFDPAVPTSDTAPALDRLVAFTGRAA
jgi:hypothetical protein